MANHRKITTSCYSCLTASTKKELNSDTYLHPRTHMRYINISRFSSGERQLIIHTTFAAQYNIRRDVQSQ